MVEEFRFRTRSASAMLFTIVVPNWLMCRKRVRSELRSFANHCWLLCVDPFAAAAAAAAAAARVRLRRERRSSSLVLLGQGQVPPMRRRVVRIIFRCFLCCEPEEERASSVSMRVNYALFVASAEEQYGMERKVCTGRTFSADGQAMGFRRHTRRSRILERCVHNAERDEIVIGAHVVTLGAEGTAVERPDVEGLELSKIAKDSSTRSSQSTERSPLSLPRLGSIEWQRDTLRDLPPSTVLNPVLQTAAGRDFLSLEAEMLRTNEKAARRNLGVQKSDEAFLCGSSAVSVKEAEGQAGK